MLLKKHSLLKESNISLSFLQIIESSWNLIFLNIKAKI